MPIVIGWRLAGATGQGRSGEAGDPPDAEGGADSVTYQMAHPDRVSAPGRGPCWFTRPNVRTTVTSREVRTVSGLGSGDRQGVLVLRKVDDDLVAVAYRSGQQRLGQ
jgi:hypothetical protein